MSRSFRRSWSELFCQLKTAGEFSMDSAVRKQRMQITEFWLLDTLKVSPFSRLYIRLISDNLPISLQVPGLWRTLGEVPGDTMVTSNSPKVKMNVDSPTNQFSPISTTKNTSRLTEIRINSNVQSSFFNLWMCEIIKSVKISTRG